MANLKSNAAALWRALFRWLPVAALAMHLCGCATMPDPTDPPPSNRRAFDFNRDTFAFANGLVWEYHFDEHSNWVSNPRVPAPDYSHHCFVVARSARQFFQHARFDPSMPVADTNTYRRLIHSVLAASASVELPEDRKIVVPGYADLREFSQAQEKLLKAECGGAWHSYFQRGHWRILAPFSRSHQERMARQLAEDIRDNRPPVVHVIRFPQLSINHAIVLFGVNETTDDITFDAYDPNNPAKPACLTYHRKTRAFDFPANDYFFGGQVDIYEVYRGWLY